MILFKAFESSHVSKASLDKNSNIGNIISNIQSGIFIMFLFFCQAIYQVGKSGDDNHHFYL